MVSRKFTILDFLPHIIAGTSIGALNGAILASHHPFAEAVDRLNQLWDELGQAEILRPNTATTRRVMSYAAQILMLNFQGQQIFC